MVSHCAAGRRFRAYALLLPGLFFISLLTAASVAYARDEQKQPVDQSDVVDEAPLLSSGFNDGIVADTLTLLQTLFPSQK